MFINKVSYNYTLISTTICFSYDHILRYIN